MARLPIPGEDKGTWGSILNDYLVQSHTANGALKDNVVTSSSLAPGAVSATHIEDNSIAEVKLDAAARTKLNGAGGTTNLSTSTTTASVVVHSSSGNDATLSSADATHAGVLTGSDKAKLDGIASGAEVNAVSSVAGKTGAVTLAKSDVGLGNVDNTADTDKPISDATQIALNAKAAASSLATIATTGSYSDLTNVPSTFTPTAHTHAAIDIASGVLDMARIPTGTTGSTVALGNHTHSGYLPIKNGNPTITDSTNDRFVRVDISDDGTATAGWPDRLAFYFSGIRSGYFNEYGEIRARPAKSNTVALRAQKWASSSTVDIFQVTSSDNATIFFSVGPTAATLSVPINSTANIATTGTVSGSNIGNKVTASSTAPSYPAVGDVWVDLSS